MHAKRHEAASIRTTGDVIVAERDGDATEMRQAIHSWSGSPQERGGGLILELCRILSPSLAPTHELHIGQPVSAGGTPRPITSVARGRRCAKGADVASAGMQAKGRGPCLRRSICVLGQAAWAAGGVLLNAVPRRATAFSNNNSLRITATSATFPVFPRFRRPR